MMKKLILLFFLISTSCFSQRITKIVESYVLIDTDKNIGKKDDEIIVQRLDHNMNIINIGKLRIVKFAQGKTAAQIIKEYEGYKITVGDYLEQHFKNEESLYSISKTKESIKDEHPVSTKESEKDNDYYYNEEPKWNNICPDPDVSYCNNVGKNAHNNNTNPPALRGIRLGKIIGVAWQPKGSIIGYEEAIPSANIPAKSYLSPRDAYYYIIDDGWGDPFLRQCREIDAK